MRPDLVLDDDDKRKRFRKLFVPTSDYESPQQPQPSTVETPEIILEDGDGASGETEKDCEEMSAGLALQLDVDNMLADLAQDESFLDPETGEVSQPSTQPGLKYVLSQKNNTSPALITTKNSTIRVADASSLMP